MKGYIAAWRYEYFVWISQNIHDGTNYDTSSIKIGGCSLLVLIDKEGPLIASRIPELDCTILGYAVKKWSSD